MTVTEPILTTLRFTRKLSVKKFCVEFHENPKKVRKKKGHTLTDGRTDVDFHVVQNIRVYSVKFKE